MIKSNGNQGRNEMDIRITVRKGTVYLNGSAILTVDRKEHRLRNGYRYGADFTVTFSTLAGSNGISCASQWYIPSCASYARKPLTQQVKDILINTKIGRKIVRRAVRHNALMNDSSRKLQKSLTFLLTR
jgi:hypothetical protein